MKPSHEKEKYCFSDNQLAKFRRKIRSCLTKRERENICTASTYYLQLPSLHP